MSFIQNLFTSRDNNANSATYVGQQDRLWWDPVTNRFYYSDGETPGGFPVGGGTGTGNSIGNGTTNVAIPVLDGNVAVTVAGVANTVVFGTANTTFAGNLLPTANTYTLGTPDKPWKSLYVSGNTIYIDNNVMSSDGPGLYWNGLQVVAAAANGTIDAAAVSVTGNVTGDYFIGNGSQLTGISVSSNKIFNGNSYANIPVADGNVEINANGNSWTFDTDGNLTTSGNLKLVTNSNLWNFDTNGTLTLPGNSLQIGLIGGNSGLKNLNSYDITITADSNVWVFGADGALTLPGNLTTTANIAGNYILGNGSQLTGLPATYGNADVAAYLPTYTGNLVSLTGNITTTANIQGAYLIGNGSQLTGVTASAANIFNTVIANTTPLVADSPNDTVTLASGNNIVITGDAATDTATFAVSDNPVFSGNVTADYFIGDFGSNVMADRGADPSNWNTMTEMGVYTVNRASWSGTVGTPLDSQVFVGLVEVKNSTDTALAQVFYPGTVQNSDVKIQWNRTYWNGTWSSWIKIVNDEQIVIGGEF